VLCALLKRFAMTSAALSPPASMGSWVVAQKRQEVAWREFKLGPRPSRACHFLSQAGEWQGDADLVFTDAFLYSAAGNPESLCSSGILVLRSWVTRSARARCCPRRLGGVKTRRGKQQGVRSPLVSMDSWVVAQTRQEVAWREFMSWGVLYSSAALVGHALLP
jgi:hypothetical protein